MINCLIIDDEQPAINIVVNYLQHVPYLNLVGTTTNSIEGLDRINNEAIDLVFLDIQMPNITGIDLIKAIKGKCKIIIITAYPEFALDGYELEVIDYLLKPVPLPRFLKATQKAKDLLEKKANNNDEEDFILVKGDTKGKLIKIEIEEIDYVEGTGNYVTFHCGAKKILALINMKDIEEKLAAHKFIRVHKSFIVAISKIELVDGNEIKLKNKAMVLVGKVYKPMLLERLKSQLIE